MTANQVVAATNIGTLAYTPPANANGTGYASFTFKVSDGTAESAADYTMTITVTAVNDAPTVANTIPDQPATVGTAFSYAFPANTFSDADTGDMLTYTARKPTARRCPRGWASPPARAPSRARRRRRTWGRWTVKVTASDGNGGSVSGEFDITVSAAANNLATGALTITGTAQVGQTLRAGTTGIMDADGLNNVSYTYQWIRVATDNTETNISGATAEHPHAGDGRPGHDGQGEGELHRRRQQPRDADQRGDGGRHRHHRPDDGHVRGLLVLGLGGPRREGDYGGAERAAIGDG